MAEFRPDEWPSFVETRAFADAWRRLGLGDDDMARLRAGIMVAPESHRVMPGTGGLRKARLADPGGIAARAGRTAAATSYRKQIRDAIRPVPRLGTAEASG